MSQVKRFAEWQRELSKQERGTDDYKKIALQVYDEYMRLKKVSGSALERFLSSISPFTNDL